MLTEAQKDAIRDFLPKQFTASVTGFSASVLYDNQFAPGARPIYAHFNSNKQPLIVLEYDKTTDEAPADLGGFEVDLMKLIINVYATDIDTRGEIANGEYVHGPKIVDAMVKSIRTALASFNSSLKAEGLSIDVLPHKIPVNDLSDIASQKHVYRKKLTIPIIYEVK
jgi:hypothetical protein